MGTPRRVLELAETPEEGVRREAWEESGVHVEVDRLTGVSKNTTRGIVTRIPPSARPGHCRSVRPTQRKTALQLLPPTISPSL
ncbi:NUDIX hydrolase [Nocardiopsis alba]|uniref:NUDIX hydrolase n=1 Tax=Nocardiopsis alba TaxID=53437 RepID=UPI00366C396E